MIANRALGLMLVVLVSSSCTILFFANSDVEGLDCGPADGNARCSDGFVCVEAADGNESCVKAGFKKEGEVCSDSGECADEGVCADVYAGRCGEDQAPEHVLDCLLKNANDGGLRCRRPCNDNFTCGGGQRCFDLGVVEIPPFCQEGTCATDGDCFANNTRGFCVEEGLNGGRSGLCRVQCDPLACFDLGEDCECVEGQTCASPPDDNAVSSRAICTVPGNFGQGTTCDVINGCALGLTCAPVVGVGNVCLQWCDASGAGAPACDQGGCSGVDGDVGICFN
jgi:hypothetical protein